MEYAITAAFLLAVVAGSFAAVILGGYGVAQVIASALDPQIGAVVLIGPKRAVERAFRPVPAGRRAFSRILHIGVFARRSRSYWRRSLTTRWRRPQPLKLLRSTNG